jgi:hypothetical protein
VLKLHIVKKRLTQGQKATNGISDHNQPSFHTMFFRIAADLMVLLHLCFIVFVMLGGLLVFWKRYLALFHLPAVLWGALVEYMSWRCPLTPLEQGFRIAGNEAGYSNGFMEHYLLPLIYPAQLTAPTQVILGTLVIVVNLTIYALIILKIRRSRKSG